MTLWQKIQAASALPTNAGHSMWDHVQALGNGLLSSSQTTVAVQGGVFVSIQSGTSVNIETKTTIEVIDD